MAYPMTTGIPTGYGYPAYQSPYPDQLAQMRQQQYPQQMPAMQNQQQQNSNFFWVQGEAGAKAFLAVPGAPPVLLLDSESPRFYLKSADGLGVPSLETFEYNKITPGTQTAQSKSEATNYVTQDAIDRVRAELAELNKRIDLLTAPKATRTNGKKEAADNG